MVLKKVLLQEDFLDALILGIIAKKEKICNQIGLYIKNFNVNVLVIKLLDGSAAVAHRAPYHQC